MGKTVVVKDKMQTDYEYELSESPGENFQWDFEPQLTPKQMLELGVFGGKYMTDCTDEFPDDWFENAKLSAECNDADMNFFGVHASQPLSVWRDKGWIREQDPRGWFQWYCRYYLGRRSDDDERQIKRWRNFRRHEAQVRKFCEQYDFRCRPRQRQALLHWAYDSRDF